LGIFEGEFMAGTNQWGNYYDNTGTVPIEYGNPGVSENNPWGFPVPGVDSESNQNVNETNPNPPTGGINPYPF